MTARTSRPQRLSTSRRLKIALLVAVQVVGGLVGLGRADAADPCSAPVNVIACENSKPGTPESSGRPIPATPIVGFATDISTTAGGRVDFKVNAARRPVHHRHLPGRLLRRQRRPADHHHQPVGHAAPEPARLPPGPVDRPRRLRQLGRVRQLERPGNGRVGRVLRLLRADRRHGQRRQQHRDLRRPRRHPAQRHPVPDLRHDVAGLQPLRRQQPLLRQPRRVGPTRSATTGPSPTAARRTSSGTPSTR